MKKQMFYILSLENTRRQDSARLEFLEPYVRSGRGFPVKDVMDSTNYFFTSEEPFTIYEIEVEDKSVYIHEKDGMILEV